MRFLRSLLSVCKHSCVVSAGQTLGGEKWNRLSRGNVEPLLCWRTPAERSSVSPYGAALLRGWGPSTAPGQPREPGLCGPLPCEARAAGQTDLVASSRRSESRWPF